MKKTIFFTMILAAIMIQIVTMTEYSKANSSWGDCCQSFHVEHSDGSPASNCTLTVSPCASICTGVTDAGGDAKICNLAFVPCTLTLSCSTGTVPFTPCVGPTVINIVVP